MHTTFAPVITTKVVAGAFFVRTSALQTNHNLTKRIMEVTIQISDAVYAQLLNKNKRIQGTLALVNPTEGNFNAHNKTWRPNPDNRYLKLPHGCITVTEEKVRMNLLIKRDECIIPAQAIEAESNLASNFVEFMEEIFATE